jgi:DNA repair photolyase
MEKRFKKNGGHAWKEEQLRVDPLSVKVPKKSGRIMYPTTHDITPKYLDKHVIIIRRLLEIGNTLLIVSKPHLECIVRLCEEFASYKDRITFRFTIGSTDNEVLKFWEPGAPSFEERLISLIHAHQNGFVTSISIEPMLEGDIDALIAAVSPFVTDTIWLGKINRLKSILAINGFKQPEILVRAYALIKSQNDDAIKQLYIRYKDNPKIRFKESIKKIVGMELQSKAGMDL